VLLFYIAFVGAPGFVGTTRPNVSQRAAPDLT